ncbi:MAG: TIGR02281 family clan AA aspartic protease [Rhizobiaceae bacterium]|nr:TIGR02281 family clan AA aspartic protease [Rhizobiaceae bacterium]
MSRILIVALAILGIGVAVLIATHASGTVGGLASDDFARLLSLGALALVIGSGILAVRGNFGFAVRAMAGWLLVILVLVAGYQYRYELQDVASRVTAGLIPGSPLSVTDADGRVTVMLERRPHGHFDVDGSIDGAPVRFLVDTGATSTVLTYEDARRAGFDTGALSFTIPVATANGRTNAASLRGVDISVGGIERRSQTVLVAADGALEQSLLGMGFISSLSGFDMRGDRLILRD